MLTPKFAPPMGVWWQYSMDDLWPTASELKAANVIQCRARQCVARRRGARRLIFRVLRRLWPVYARRQQVKRNVLKARMQQAMQRTAAPEKKLTRSVKRDRFCNTCVFRLRSRGITNVIGAKKDLVLLMNPHKHTVRNLMCDIYRAVRKPFVATLNGRKLSLSDKKLYRINVFAGGVFLIEVTEIQSDDCGNGGS